MKGTVWELQGTNCQAGAPWSTFPHLWRSDLRYTMIMSLEQHMSASGGLYLPSKTHGLEFKPDKLHKYRKITTGDKRRRTAVEEFNSSRSWEGNATKAGHRTAMLYWKHEEQQKVMSTFFWEYYNGKRECVYIMSMRALVDHQLQKEQKYIYSKKKKRINIISRHDRFSIISPLKLAWWKKKLYRSQQIMRNGQ